MKKKITVTVPAKLINIEPPKEFMPSNETTVEEMEELAKFLIPMYELRDAALSLMNDYSELLKIGNPLANPNNLEEVKRLQRAIMEFHKVVL
jgi:hypothetical protein